MNPNPRYLFPGPNHREVLASLVYAIESDLGFSALIAEPGMGKTTILYSILQRFRSARVALVFDTQCNAHDLLRHIAFDLGIPVGQQDSIVLHDHLRRFLVKQFEENRRVIVMVDEAQNLDEEALECLRLLSNFETPERKLLHIILAGQPQLGERLASPLLRQLSQRLSMICRIVRFSAHETSAYIHHRLRVAGYLGAALFEADAIAAMHVASEGVPRNINRLCFSALSLACALGRRSVDRRVVEDAAKDCCLFTVASNVAENADRTSQIGHLVTSSQSTVWPIGDNPPAGQPSALRSPPPTSVLERQTRPAREAIRVRSEVCGWPAPAPLVNAADRYGPIVHQPNYELAGSGIRPFIIGVAVLALASVVIVNFPKQRRRTQATSQSSKDAPRTATLPQGPPVQSSGSASAPRAAAQQNFRFRKGGQRQTISPNANGVKPLGGTTQPRTISPRPAETSSDRQSLDTPESTPALVTNFNAHDGVRIPTWIPQSRSMSAVRVPAPESADLGGLENYDSLNNVPAPLSKAQPVLLPPEPTEPAPHDSSCKICGPFNHLRRWSSSWRRY